MFMKWDGDDFIIHCVAVDDFATITESKKLKDEIQKL
jgi:hypothetical protein